MRAGAISAAVLAVALSAGAPASAEKPDEKAEAPPVAAELELRVHERGPDLPWRMTVTNSGKHPVLVSSDPRLLWFEVKVPGKRAKTTCRLPSELVPDHRIRRLDVILPPGRGFVRDFDPRFYCFSAGDQKALVPGAVITAHFGWKQKTKVSWKRGRRVETEILEPPFVAETPPTRRRTRRKQPRAELKPERGLHAESFALRSSYISWAATKPPPEEKEKGWEPKLELSMARGSDASSERSTLVTVKLHNPTKRTVAAYFRRELVTFEVMGPDGLETCNAQPDLRAPDRQAFLSVSPGRTLSISSRLVELCPRGTFSRPGLYLVTARFDANDRGQRFGMRAFTGRVVAAKPVTIRVRTGEKPFVRRVVPAPARSRR